MSVSTPRTREAAGVSPRPLGDLDLLEKQRRKRQNRALDEASEARSWNAESKRNDDERPGEHEEKTVKTKRTGEAKRRSERDERSEVRRAKAKRDEAKTRRSEEAKRQSAPGHPPLGKEEGWREESRKEGRAVEARAPRSARSKPQNRGARKSGRFAEWKRPRRRAGQGRSDALEPGRPGDGGLIARPVPPDPSRIHQ